MFPLVFVLPLPCALTRDEGGTLCLAADGEKRAQYAERPDSARAAHSLASQALLRYAASRALQTPMPKIRIRYTDRGKPYLDGADLFCSVSHTQGLCVCALSDCEVGVDVERVRPVTNRVARRVFSSAEQAALRESHTPDRTFFEIWTKHESYVKCLGTGLADIASPIDARACFRTFSFAENYVISVCTFTKTS